jgi:hypothetical protein
MASLLVKEGMQAGKKGALADSLQTPPKGNARSSLVNAYSPIWVPSFQKIRAFGVDEAIFSCVSPASRLGKACLLAQFRGLGRTLISFPCSCK